MENNLKNLVSSLDSKLGEISLSIEDLEAIETSLGHVMQGMEDVDKTDLEAMGWTLLHMFPYIRVADSLLGYSVKDLSKNYKETNDLNSELFESVFQDNKESNEVRGDNQ